MRLRDGLRRIPLLAWIIGPAALAALIAWPLGGWDTVELVSREVPQFESNQTLQGHRFDLRVDDAWLASGHPAASDLQRGERLLIVRVEVTNRSDQPAYVGEFADYVVPQIVADATPTAFALVADGTRNPELNPGVGRVVDLIWTIQSGSVEVGDNLSIDIYDALPRDSFVYFGKVWDPFLAGVAERTVSEK